MYNNLLVLSAFNNIIFMLFDVLSINWLSVFHYFYFFLSSFFAASAAPAFLSSSAFLAFAFFFFSSSSSSSGSGSYENKKNVYANYNIFITVLYFCSHFKIIYRKRIPAKHANELLVSSDFQPFPPNVSFRAFSFCTPIQPFQWDQIHQYDHNLVR